MPNPKPASHGSNPSASRPFGSLLKDYRERQGLSQRKVAALLGVDESTIAKVEAGTRKSPQEAAFYDRLWDIPGITEPEVRALLRARLNDLPGLTELEIVVLRGALAGGGPLTAPPKADADLPDFVETASVAGFSVSLGFHIGPAEIDGTELEGIASLVREDIEMFLRAWFRLRAERTKRLLEVAESLEENKSREKASLQEAQRLKEETRGERAK